MEALSLLKDTSMAPSFPVLKPCSGTSPIPGSSSATHPVSCTMETSAPNVHEPRTPAYGRQDPVTTGRPFTWPTCQDWAAGAKFPLAMLASRKSHPTSVQLRLRSTRVGGLVLWFGPHRCGDLGLRQPWHYDEHGLTHKTLTLSATALSSATCEQPAFPSPQRWASLQQGSPRLAQRWPPCHTHT